MKAFGLTIATLTIASRSTIAQNISQVLTQYTQLSSLSAIIANSSALSTQLDAADNFTFLAPSNDAITAWTQSSPSDTSIDAVLAYHLLSDVINIVNFDASHRHIPPYFIPSALNDSTYTNVTGGQRVGMYYIGEMGQVEFQSGNKTISQIITANIIANGGIVHIVDTVLEIPLPPLTEASAAQLDYLITVFQSGDYLDTANEAFVRRIASMADTTLFFPNNENVHEFWSAFGDSNSPQTEAYFSNQSQLDTLLEYHALEGLYYSTNFTNGTTLKTISGLPVLVTIDENSEIYLNTAKITTPDYLTSNGVMRVVESVLSPLNITRPVLSSANNTTSSTHPQSHTPPVSFPTTVTPPSSNPSSGLSAGSKAGIGVSVAIGAGAIITAFAVYWYRRRRRTNIWESEAPPVKQPDIGQLQSYPELETHEQIREMEDAGRHELSG